MEAEEGGEGLDQSQLQGNTKQKTKKPRQKGEDDEEAEEEADDDDAEEEDSDDDATRAEGQSLALERTAILLFVPS